MYLSTRISRLYKRGHFLSLSLHICVYVCVCVLDWYFRACSVCVEGGGWRDYSPPGFQNYFLFPLSTSLFFSFLMIFPLPGIGTEYAPFSPSLCNVYLCVFPFSLLVVGLWVGVGVELVVNLISSPLLLSIQGYIYFYDCKEKNKMILSSIIKSLTDIFCYMK